MLVRCAYYVGTVDPKDQKTFDDYVLNVHLPMVATWPRLRRLRHECSACQKCPHRCREHQVRECVHASTWSSLFAKGRAWGGTARAGRCRPTSVRRLVSGTELVLKTGSESLYRSKCVSTATVDP